MKKTLPIILALMLILFAGCTSSPIKNDGAELTTYSSDNGYTVSYPVGYEPTSLSSSIDFVIMDEVTGSTVTVFASAHKENVLDITEEDFSEQKKSEGINIRIKSFEFKTINDTPALVATYKYNENNVTEIIYDASDNTYYTTYTELPGTSERLSSELLSVIYSLMV